MSAALPGTFPRAYGRFLNPVAMPEYSKHKERAWARARLLTALTQHPQARPQRPAPVFLLGNTPSEVLLFQPRYGACIRHSPAYYPCTMPHGQQAELSLAPAHLSSTFSLLAHIYPAFPPHQTPTAPWKDTVVSFFILLQALPLPTGLGEAQVSPPWRSCAGSSVP